MLTTTRRVFLHAAILGLCTFALAASPPFVLVKPNPVKEGGTVTVRGRANSWVIVRHKKGSRIVHLDKRGEARFKAPGKAGEEFLVKDPAVKPTWMIVQVVER